MHKKVVFLWTLQKEGIVALRQLPPKFVSAPKNSLAQVAAAPPPKCSWLQASLPESFNSLKPCPHWRLVAGNGDYSRRLLRFS